MSKILSIIALSGSKDAAVSAAADDLRAALLYSIRDGNTRNMEDTANALRDAGAIKKDGGIASNRKGLILSMLLSAHDAGQGARAIFAAEFTGHKGKPSAAMTERARAMVSPIIEAFEDTARGEFVKAPMSKAQKEAKAQEKADAAAKAETEANAKKEADEKALTEAIADGNAVLDALHATIAERDATIAALREQIAILKAQGKKQTAQRKAKTAEPVTA